MRDLYHERNRLQEVKNRHSIVLILLGLNKNVINNYLIFLQNIRNYRFHESKIFL